MTSSHGRPRAERILGPAAGAGGAVPRADLSMAAMGGRGFRGPLAGLCIRQVTSSDLPPPDGGCEHALPSTAQRLPRSRSYSRLSCCPCALSSYKWPIPHVPPPLVLHCGPLRTVKPMWCGAGVINFPCPVLGNKALVSGPDHGRDRVGATPHRSLGLPPPFSPAIRQIRRGFGPSRCPAPARKPPGVGCSVQIGSRQEKATCGCIVHWVCT